MNNSPGLSAKAIGGLVLFILGCLLSSARIVHEARNSHEDIAKNSDQRFVALRAELPAKGVVGYVGEPESSSLPDYYLTQYALAPLVVERNVDHALVVGNFPNGRNPTIPAQLREIRDFGNGLILFANRDAK